MKKLILSITLLFFGMYLLAQKECTDVIHPADYKKSITNCCIKDVKPGNIVVYSSDGLTYETAAIAISYRGEYVYLTDNKGVIGIKIREDNYQGILYQGHNGEHYQRLLAEANGKIIFGTVISISGIGMIVAGRIIIRNNFKKWYSSFNTASLGDGTGIVFFIAGVAGCVGGVFLLIDGINKRKPNKKALDEFNKLNLSLGITNDGIGLVLRF